MVVDHTKWEYKIVALSSSQSYDQLFNELGKQGWELVEFRMIHVHYTEAYFKRKLIDG